MSRYSIQISNSGPFQASVASMLSSTMRIASATTSSLRRTGPPIPVLQCLVVRERRARLQMDERIGVARRQLHRPDARILAERLHAAARDVQLDRDALP